MMMKGLRRPQTLYRKQQENSSTTGTVSTLVPITQSNVSKPADVCLTGLQISTNQHANVF